MQVSKLFLAIVLLAALATSSKNELLSRCAVGLAAALALSAALGLLG